MVIAPTEQSLVTFMLFRLSAVKLEADLTAVVRLVAAQLWVLLTLTRDKKNAAFGM
jgi:hypothetical protein